MAKADRIAHKMVAVLVDGVELHRVQRFSATSDLPVESTGEIGNENVIEYIKGSPDVTINIETNNVGSNDNLSLVADQIFYKTSGVNAVTNKNVGPIGGTYAWAIKAASSNNATQHTVEAVDMVTAYVDITVPVTEDNTNVTRTMWIHNAALTNVSWSFDVNGMATENFQLKAGNKRWFMNAFKNARVTRLYPKTASAWNAKNGVVYHSAYASAVPSGSRLLYYCVNNKIYAAGSTSFGYVDNAGDGFVRAATAGFFLGAARTGFLTFSTPGVTSGIDTSIGRNGTDNVWAVYIPPTTWSSPWKTSVSGSQARLNSTAPGYQLVSNSTAHGGTGRAYLKLWLYNTAGPLPVPSENDASRALRLQTVNIDSNMNSEPLVQLGALDPYGYSRNLPVPVTVNVTAKDSDLQYFCTLGATAYTAAKSFDISAFNGRNRLVVEIYKEASRTTKLRTIVVNNMSVTGEGHEFAYQGDGNYNISFSADNWRSFGTGVNTTGY